MSDFDRTLAGHLGHALVEHGTPSRELVAECYRATLHQHRSQEEEQVTEKWIDHVWRRIEGMKIHGKNAEQVAQRVFELIVKA